MATVIDELVTVLGFEVDGKAANTVNKFGKSIDTVVTYAAAASAALLAAAGSVMYFAERNADAAGELYDLSKVTGIATDTLQELAFAQEQCGGSAESMTSDLQGLLASMSSPIPGEFNQALAMLGIATRDASGELRNVDDVLMDVSDSMQGMSAQDQLQWGDKIGLSKDTIRTLQSGRAEIDALRKQAQDIPTIVSEENLKNAKLLSTQLKLVGRVIEYIGQTIASAAGPAIKEVVSSMTEWLGKNKEFIQSGLKAIVEGIVRGFTTFWDILGRMNDAVSKLLPDISGFTGLLTDADAVAKVITGALIALSAALAILAVNFIIANAPIFALGAAIAAVGLIIDDFLTFLDGGDSVFGDFVDWLSSGVEWVKALSSAFAEAYPGIAAFFSAIADFFSNNIFAPFIETITVVLGLLKEVGAIIVGQLIDNFKTMGKIVAFVFNGIVGNIKSVLGLADKFLGLLGFGDDESEEEEAPDQPGGKQRKTPELNPHLRKRMQEAGEKEDDTYATDAYYADASRSKGPTQNETLAAVRKTLAAPDAEAKIRPMVAQAETTAQMAAQPVATTTNNANTSTQNTNNIEITNNITGSNAEKIAAETTKKMNYTLQQIAPGGMSPVVS